jgi:hypothetical protein
MFLSCTVLVLKRRFAENLPAPCSPEAKKTNIVLPATSTLGFQTCGIGGGTII